MKVGPKYLWMNKKTHVMMDIFGHTSHNLAGSGSAGNIAKHTHSTGVLGLMANGLGGSYQVNKCNTCLKYFKTGMNLAFKNDPSGLGNPLGKAWSTIGGADNLQDAWNNGKPERYFPGVEVLINRKRFGKVVGWENVNTPIFQPRRVSTYSEAVLRQEIANVQGAVVGGSGFTTTTCMRCMLTPLEDPT